MDGSIMAVDKETQELDERGRKELGIRPSVYGLGTGFRNGLVTTGIVTTTMTAIGSALQFRAGVDIVKYIRYPKDLLAWAINRGAQYVSSFMRKNTLPKAAQLPQLTESPPEAGVAATIFTIAGASFGLAYLLSHVAQIPGFVQGTIKGKEAVRRYESVVGENRRLREENARLQDAVDHNASTPAPVQTASTIQSRPSFRETVAASREPSADTSPGLHDF
jgi:hypothetical protein